MGGSKKRKNFGRKERRRFRRLWARALQEQSKSLLQYARRLTNGDEARAQDLVQSVFERILRYCPKPGTINSIPHYLLRCVRNVWASSNPRIEEISWDDAIEQIVQFPKLAIQPRTQENLELKEIMEQVLDEMAQMHSELRIIWDMKIEGYTFAEIDAYLDRDVGFSQFVWRRFQNRLKKRLKPPRPGKSKPEGKEKPAA